MNKLLQVSPFLICYLLWEAMFRLFPGTVTQFPPPSEFVAYLFRENFSLGLGPDQQGMLQAIAASCFRVLAGLACALAAAVISAVAICVVVPLRAGILPLIRLLAPIAPIAWLPLALALFGAGNLGAIFLVAMGTYFVLVIGAVAAIDQTDQKLLIAAQTLGATSAQRWFGVILPSIAPQLLVMLRLNFIGAWMAVLAAEMVGLRDGLGTIILIGRESYNPNLILIGMTLIGASGYLIDHLLLGIQKRFLWWSGSQAA